MTMIPYAGAARRKSRGPSPPKPVDPAYPKGKRGFAAMSPERQREIAILGGKALKPEQRTFSVDRQLAAEAGRKGRQKLDPALFHFNDRAFASAAGKKGAAASHRAKAAKKQQGAG